MSAEQVLLSVFNARGLVRPRRVALKEARVIDANARRLGLRLGLGDLNARNDCRSYVHGCVCDQCLTRAGSVTSEFRCWLETNVERMPRYREAARRPAQPWEVSRLAA